MERLIPPAPISLIEDMCCLRSRVVHPSGTNIRS